MNETKEKVKYTLEIVQDEYGESPNKWGNTDVFLVYDHRQFTIREKGFDPRAIFNHLNAKSYIERKQPETINESLETEGYFEDLNDEFDKYHIFQVNAYIHSGVALSLHKDYPFNDKWDTSTTGYILVDKNLASKVELDITIKSKYPEKAFYLAEGLIETWNQYLSGDVWGYEISKTTTCECCGNEDKQVVDSCYGFYGKEECENEGNYSLKILNKEE